MEEFEKLYVEPDTQSQRNLDHSDHIAALHRKDSLGYLSQDTRIFKCVSPSIHCPCKRCHFRRMETALQKVFKAMDADMREKRVWDWANEALIKCDALLRGEEG